MHLLSVLFFPYSLPTYCIFFRSSQVIKRPPPRRPPLVPAACRHGLTRQKSITL